MRWLDAALYGTYPCSFIFISSYAHQKSQIYSSLWSACDELRGGMDASQYKDYILTLLFIKYISDLHKAGRRSLIVVPGEPASMTCTPSATRTIWATR